MEKLVRSRVTRLSFAFVLVVIGLWAFLPYVVYRVATSAFVNAELVRVTAPISGEVAHDLPSKGKLMDGMNTTRLVVARRPDRRALVTLEQQYEVSDAQVALATTQLEEVIAADRKLSRQTARHRAAVLERLARESEETKANLAACRAEEQHQQKTYARAAALAEIGIVAKQRLDDVEGARASTAARCQATSAQIGRLKAEAAAARDGVFLQDGFNDMPYSEQQRDRLLQRRQELEASLLNGRSRLAQLSAEIAEERRRVEQFSSYDAALPAGHIVWNVLASPGSATIEGQPLIDLADCRRRFIVVEVPERDFESIRTGDPAAVRLLGADDWLHGTVQKTRGSAARNDDRLLAAQIPNPGVRAISVEIALPPESDLKEGTGFCDIGRLAEVRFERDGLGVGSGIAAAWRRLSGVTGFRQIRVADGSLALAP